MRASINTWRTGMSSLAISCCTCSSLVATSVTNNWLVRVSQMALPRGLSRREALAKVGGAELVASAEPRPVICAASSAALA